LKRDFKEAIWLVFQDYFHHSPKVIHFLEREIHSTNEAITAKRELDSNDYMTPTSWLSID
jgi:hypothetical protein